MKRIITVLTVAAMLLLYVPVCAAEIESIVWETELEEIVLPTSMGGELPLVHPKSLEGIVVSFSGGDTEYASITMVPVADGAATAPVADNIVLIAQQAVSEGSARFGFYPKPTIENGIYAIHAGGTGAEYVTGYLEVSDAEIPAFEDKQVLQYDDYKENIKLKFEVTDQSEFEEWITNKDNITVTLNGGGKFAEVNPGDFEFNSKEGTISIKTADYADIFPAFGSRPDKNIQQTEISVSSPGYWAGGKFGGAQKSNFGLVIPEISAEGFAEGVDFELVLYAEKGLSEAVPIIAVYDNGILVCSALGDEVELEAGIEKNIPVTVKCTNLKPSGSFSVKALLWQGSSIMPLTSIVKFP